ncbi:MAG: PepSY-associated TM helix domain-containing protein [Hyphomonas sp.]
MDIRALLVVKFRFASARSDKQVPESPQPGFFDKLSTIGFWKRQARTWHWMSGAICLLGMLLFALTGITLNHARDIEASPRITEHEFVLSEDALEHIGPDIEFADGATVPGEVARAVRHETGARISGVAGEWTDLDVYISLPRPGGDAWMTIDRTSGDVLYEVTDRGAVSYLNDLHKGRNTGAAWSFFLDVFAVACMVFCLSGLWLLQIHSMRRGSTWPLVASGIGIPVLLLLFFVHL